MTNLQLRVISGVAMAIVALIAVWMGGGVFVAFAALVAALVWKEWLEMNAPSRDDRLLVVTVALIALAALLLVVSSGMVLIYLLIMVWVVGSVLVIIFGSGPVAVVGFAYCLAALVSLAHLRGAGDFWPGVGAIIFLFAVVWATDIAAYFVGRAVGGPKLAPAISPGKTISGALGGVVGALFAAIVVRQFFDPALSLSAMLFFAFTISVASQAGDLYESFLKRRAGIKDSSQIIPGHGGVMDRVDGLVFAAVALWLGCILIAGADAPALALFAI